MNQHQIIFDAKGQPAFAVISWEEYERLTRIDFESSLSDLELYDLAQEESEESFPAEVVDRLLSGQNPVKVFRSHRNLTQAELANAIGINIKRLSQIETGKRAASTITIAALAHALDVAVDDLLLP